MSPLARTSLAIRLQDLMGQDLRTKQRTCCGQYDPDNHWPRDLEKNQKGVAPSLKPKKWQPGLSRYSLHSFIHLSSILHWAWGMDMKCDPVLILKKLA